MDLFKRYWLQIQAQSQGMTASQRWLIATVLTLGLVISGILVLVAGTPEKYAINVAPGKTAQVARSLDLAGIEAEIEGDEVLVDKADVHQAMAVIIESGLSSDDVSNAFSQLVKDQSPWITDKQGDRNYNIALQNVVGEVIEHIADVRKADVIISVPERRGFDRTFSEPSASVSVIMQAGRSLNKDIVESIASLVSGSLAELSAQNVVVVDANTGKRWRTQADDETDPSGALEMAQHNDRRYRGKIERALSYIQGVLVEVNVETSEVHMGRRLQHEYDKTEPLKSQEIEESTARNYSSGGEPGPRSNVGLDIDGSASGGNETTQNRQHSEYASKPLLQTLEEQLNGYNVERVNVAIGVPYSYFVNLNRIQNPPADDAEETAIPMPADLQPLIDEQIAQIRAQVLPLAAADQEPVVTVNWIPDAHFMPANAAGANDTGLTLASTAAEWAGPVGIVGLSGAALLMMFMMVRKATQPEQLPSVEELAGVPPDLPDEDELVGEVDEVQDLLSGVELNEEELNSRRIAQQISELIKANPEEAGHLINKWVQVDE
ncbi:hypothetical protein [Mucisphaera calidilacus]|uniref:Flagellar M-ring protein n=1 Tax=Mucisphaera calidilacus TaxID=2527982 RepID=A0A518BYY5_9BACT|nr:hypothetical protein [Mucisphaera calidilacus]QDU72187.1 Flagellar M-ring protein [Mucisphaera calidilacus]